MGLGAWLSGGMCLACMRAAVPSTTPYIHTK
jgi:hypothetical protein